MKVARVYRPSQPAATHQQRRDVCDLVFYCYTQSLFLHTSMPKQRVTVLFCYNIYAQRIMMKRHCSTVTIKHDWLCWHFYGPCRRGFFCPHIYSQLSRWVWGAATKQYNVLLQKNQLSTLDATRLFDVLNMSWQLGPKSGPKKNFFPPLLLRTY